MKLCLFCDLHLSQYRNTAQYDVLKWILDTVRENDFDVVLYAGDVTADGDAKVYREFVETMEKLPVPFLWVPGNSDMRTPETVRELHACCSPLKTRVGEKMILAVNDADGTISDEAYEALSQADDTVVVFMHHPSYALRPEHREKMERWSKAHPEVTLFVGHKHLSKNEGNVHWLQAADPDKAIGEPPCIAVFDTETKTLEKRFYPFSMPQDVYDYFGISCYDPIKQIDFAIEKGLRCIELRPNFITLDQTQLKAKIDCWRKQGGENLSVHLPDVAWEDGTVVSPNYAETLEKAKALGTNRFTQHVPQVSVREATAAVLKMIADFIAAHFSKMPESCVIGVENMHMRKGKDLPDDSRRYGYLPQETLEFMQLVRQRCRQKVGINLDIGHARNNMPFSQTYPVGVWYGLVGQEIVGYHIHQVTNTENGMENHVAITDIFGPMISLASLLESWEKGRVNHAPFIFEMRPEGAYEATLETFANYRK